MTPDDIERSKPPPEQSAGDIGDAARDAAHTIGGAAGEFKHAAGEAAAEARAGLSDRAEAGKETAVDSLRRVANQLRSTAQTMPRGDEWARSLMLRGAEGAETASTYLSGHRINDLVGDAQEFARRNPAAYMGASIAAGFALARLGKTAALRASGWRPDDDRAAEPSTFNEGEFYDRP